MKRHTGFADAYARYAELISAQLAAIDSGDLDSFTALTRERQDLATAIDGMHATDPAASADSAYLAMPGLEAALAADGKLREKLAAIQHDSLDGARSIDRNRDAIRSYASHAEPGTQVDLSL
jgi:hypothetical protein